jgi:hypothetical protein
MYSLNSMMPLIPKQLEAARPSTFIAYPTHFVTQQ